MIELLESIELLNQKILISLPGTYKVFLASILDESSANVHMWVLRGFK